MIIIFCQDPLDPKQVDALYQTEADTAHQLGMTYHLINFEDVTAGMAHRAVKRVPQPATLEHAIYRGWMLTPTHYQHLYEALLARHIRLINTPDMYRHCHYLPESYAIIANYTPKSVWLKADDQLTPDAIHTALRVFNHQPIMLKDYVKSQKHYWHEACFIPHADDQQAVEAVVSRFRELQGADLNEGLVFREFIEFRPVAGQSEGDMPLTEEFRIFVLAGNPIFHTRYWSEGDYADVTPAIQPFEAVMKQVKSQFFTMDIARRADGTWMIVELGDGQVAGLADHVDTRAFYEALLQN